MPLDAAMPAPTMERPARRGQVPGAARAATMPRAVSAEWAARERAHMIKNAEANAEAVDVAAE